MTDEVRTDQVPIRDRDPISGAAADGANHQVPIRDHGLIGDLRTAALVGLDGTIDWFCPGRFDAPSVFASLLDADRGGAWRLAPIGGSVRTQQFYFPDSAVLATRFFTEESVIEVHDFMPVLRAHDADHRQRIVRRVTAVRGRARVRTVMAARPDYAQAGPALKRDGDVVLVTGDGLRLSLTSTVKLTIEGDDVVAEVDLARGETALFVLEVLGEGDPTPAPCTEEDTHALFDATNRFWRRWISQSVYRGRWRETVHRSAITLKLLTHEPTGAVIAAPTTSLPEVIGGERNWDYRYVWIRDAGFTLYALLRLGYTEEAAAFIRWLSERMGEQSGDDETGGSGPGSDTDLGPLRVLYDIDGNTPTAEHELDHLRGHRGSAPVRVGNAAVDQLQLDIYGEIIDSVYLFNKYGPGLSHDAWRDMLRIIDWLLANWDREDAGMWEVRGGDRAHTTSRLMAWVAVERMIRMARQRGLPGDIEAWSSVRDQIYARILDHSWNEDLQAFTQVEGGTALDAGVLLMPMVKFLSPADPRFLSTLAAVEERLVADSLVFRYDPEETSDGVVPEGDVQEEEGTFSICSFWYVEALTRAGRLDDAAVALEKMFTYANHLGLYSEQISATGDQLGNFPQAFTHLALISAATNLDRALP